VAKARLREKCVYRADLEAGATASIAQFCSIDVVQPIRKEQRDGSKSGRRSPLVHEAPRSP